MRLKSLTDDPALLLVLAAASHRSFRPPWGHPRYPARDGGAERLVLSPKRPLERGFFVRHDEDVEGEPEQRAVDDEARCSGSPSTSSSWPTKNPPPTGPLGEQRSENHT